MKKVLLTILCCTMTFMATLSFAKETATSDAKNVNVMFIQTADRGTLEPIPSKPGFFKLQLKGINEYVQFFTDRPLRRAGLYPTDKFINQWQHGVHANSFNKVPPNAALSAVEVNLVKNKMINTILQLSEPTYNAKHRTVTYIVHPLKGQPSNLDRKFKNVALFIDNYCASCVGGGF